MHSRLAGVLITTLAVAAALFSVSSATFAASASAKEAGTDAVTTIVPQKASSSLAGPLSTNATPDVGSCHTTGGYGYLYNEPDKYVVGNCLDGQPFYRSRCDNATCNWSFGYVGAGVNQCLWINTWRADPFSGTHNHCATSTTIPLNQFAQVVNCAPTTCADGNNAVMNNCYTHANVQPWTTTGEYDTIRFLPAGTPVRWRYLSKDGNEIMIHDYTHDADGGTWAFVNRICIQDFDSYHLHVAGLYYP
jgi:hypothetical protein